MNDYDISCNKAEPVSLHPTEKMMELNTSNRTNLDTLEGQLAEASTLVDDIILKNYLSHLNEFEIIPIPDDLKKIENIRLFKITEMVYQKNEYATYKFASVFNSIQNLDCGVFIFIDSDGKKTDFYMGVRSLDDERTTKSLKDTLKNALYGQFPGVKTVDLRDAVVEDTLTNIKSKNIAVVSCVAQNKDENFKDNEQFIQGLEKFALAMQGKHYAMVVLAQSISSEQLAYVRQAYESIYTQLSPFANIQLSYSTNVASSVSDAFSKGMTTGISHGINNSIQSGTSVSEGISSSESETKPNNKPMFFKATGKSLLNVASMVSAPLVGGVSRGVAAGIMVAQAGLDAIAPKSITKGTSTSKNHSENYSQTLGESDTTSESISDNYTHQDGITRGTSENKQLTMQNKSLINLLERIDLQLKRIDECESLGMWECAAYFLSDSQETSEMAAGTYKALMRGEKSGVETSAINFWGCTKSKQLPLLRDYITNFIHPVFAYHSGSSTLPITAASLVSGNELAIQMGLPRKSISGFPVVIHADFGKEVVMYDQRKNSHDFILGKVLNMGRDSGIDVKLDRDSLTMHTFVTGSTGSGKSNTVYEILNQLKSVYNIPFLVVEPAKGEYKNVFGQFTNVKVYGTNPKKTELLRINPFRFPSDIHILEHLDRLVELFNVCWPMYAAMPAILKEAMEKAYISTGWDINTSENAEGDVFPNFSDLLDQIGSVINESKYSADSKGDYSGALCTRVRSLTNGLNGQIFTSKDLTDEELFDNSVIVDLSRVGSTETKALIMGLLVMKLNEYRMTSGKTNSSLSHVTVLEEAHNLLKRTSTEQSSEGSNLLGKSVELLANSIAEMRTYGEGFIIADQSPGLLDMSVIRNTNTKIILRLPERSDRELVGFAAGLNNDQVGELSKLERGVAAIYQNDWIEPILVKVNKCNVTEKKYDILPNYKLGNIKDIRQQLIFFLMQGRVSEHLDFDVNEIEQNLELFSFSSPNRRFVEKQILDYNKNKRLVIWDDKYFSTFSQRISDLLETRERVEQIVVKVKDNDELTESLCNIAKSFVPFASKGLLLSMCHSFMKDMSLRDDESDKRGEIYNQWYYYMRKGV